MFRAWEMRAGDSERGTTRGWEEGGVGVGGAATAPESTRVRGGGWGTNFIKGSL